MEAQRFVGKCLAHVSKRPSAKELLLNPFLGIDQIESPFVPSPPLLTNQALKLNSTAEVANEPLSKADRTKSTDMTITGSINEEGNTVFLKVKICDSNGMYNSIKKTVCYI